MTPIARNHALERQLHSEDHAVQVDVDHPPCRQVILVDKAAKGHDPGVVHEHIHRSQALLNTVQETREGGSVGHIQRQGNGA